MAPGKLKQQQQQQQRKKQPLSILLSLKPDRITGPDPGPSRDQTRDQQPVWDLLLPSYTAAFTASSYEAETDSHACSKQTQKQPQTLVLRDRQVVMRDARELRYLNMSPLTHSLTQELRNS